MFPDAEGDYIDREQQYQDWILDNDIQRLKHCEDHTDFLPVGNELDLDAIIEVDVDGTTYEVHLRGIIDRIFKSDEGIALMELKTGKWHNANTSKMKGEMSYYAYLLEESGAGLELGPVTHYGWRYPKADYWDYMEAKKVSITAMKKRLHKLVRAYVEHDFPPTKAEFKRGYCDFMAFCPKWTRMIIRLKWRMVKNQYGRRVVMARISDQRLETTAFTVAMEWWLQRMIVNGEVSVRMGDAKKARGFDAHHDDREAMFVVDRRYLSDPEETIDIIEKLYAWVEHWNEIEEKEMQLSVQANLIHLDYPREVNLFRRIVHDKEQFNRWWVSLDNASDAYMTVYGFRETKAPNHRRGDYQTAIVRHFVLDFDCTSIVGGKRIDVPLEVPFGEVQRLHEYLVEQNICHGVWFSGGGFHVWIKLAKVHTPRTGMESSILKGAGRWMVRQWAEHLKLNCIDPTVTFDLASLIRVPNSYSVKRQLWTSH